MKFKSVGVVSLLAVSLLAISGCDQAEKSAQQLIGKASESAKQVIDETHKQAEQAISDATMGLIGNGNKEKPEEEAQEAKADEPSRQET